MIECEQVTIDNATYKAFSVDGCSYQIPMDQSPEQAHEASWVNRQHALAADLSQIHDIIYMDGVVGREDYTVHMAPAQEMIAELEARWPKYNYRQNATNVIGRFDPYREPYVNSSISWYNMETPSSVLSEFNVSAEDYVLFPWYGLKFDLTTSSVLLKLVVDDSSISPTSRPPLPDGFKFFAVIVDSSGSIDPMVDCYTFASPYLMKKYCASVGAVYPFPDEASEQACWIWGIVYNSQTKEVAHVKGYARHDN